MRASSRNGCSVDFFRDHLEMSIFSSMTEAEVQANNARRLAERIRYATVGPGILEPPKEKPLFKKSACDDESVLHDRIIKFCRENGWLYFHGSMAVKSRRTLGEP